MEAKWYVEHFDHYEEAGGVNDLSKAFDNEAEARTFAETLTDDEITLFKVDNNLFELIDTYHVRETPNYPVGWEDAHSEVRLAEHATAYEAKQAAAREEKARSWDEMLRAIARTRAGDPNAPVYALAGTTYPLTTEDEAKIAAYCAEYEAEMAVQHHE